MNVFIFIAFFHTVDPDQRPRSVASELGLHCFHMFPNRFYSLKRVKGL